MLITGSLSASSYVERTLSGVNNLVSPSNCIVVSAVVLVGGVAWTANYSNVGNCLEKERDCLLAAII